MKDDIGEHQFLHRLALGNGVELGELFLCGVDSFVGDEQRFAVADDVQNSGVMEIAEDYFAGCQLVLCIVLNGEVRIPFQLAAVDLFSFFLKVDVIFAFFIESIVFVTVGGIVL